MNDDTPTPKNTSDELPRGAEIPEDLNPLIDELLSQYDPSKEGILMLHQKKWLMDDAPFKVCEKGRRTGITFTEALDCTLIASTKRSEGGDNCFYIGDTKDKGREFIEYVAHFARVVAEETVHIEEFMFKDIDANGDSRYISAFRIKFASGFRIEALSSRPENIRGLQGVVVIDEAAFHKNVRLVLDAVNALLIWGGKIRVISSHNGILNAFNELIQEARAGKINCSVHRYTFNDAVKNGLFKRVCYIRGEEWTQEKEDDWQSKIRNSYGSRIAAMKQELDCIPADSEGAALTRVQIENCMKDGTPVLRWSQPDEFKESPAHIRRAEANDFCHNHIKPILAKLNPRLAHTLGQDFARSGDLSAIDLKEIGKDLHRRTKLAIELHNIPFDQQEQILFFILDRLPRFAGAALDARGNGQHLAERARQKYGGLIYEVMPTQKWYLENMPPLIAAFTDGTIEVPMDEDILKDFQSLQYVNGIIKIPDGHYHKGSDGNKRHGDMAMANCLSIFASRQNYFEYGYETISDKEFREDNTRRDVEITSGISRHEGMIG